MYRELNFAPETLIVRPWPDEVLDHLGPDPRSAYAEDFWLPVLGPSTLLLLRRFASGFDCHPEGYGLDLGETARSLGLGDKSGRHSPFLRAINRCTQFGMAQLTGPEDIAVRRRLPPLGRQHLRRLSPALQARHEAWVSEQAQVPAGRDQLLRARRLALSLFEVGEDWSGVERQLVRWHYRAEHVRDALSWAQEQQRWRPDAAAEASGGHSMPA